MDSLFIVILVLIIFNFVYQYIWITFYPADSRRRKKLNALVKLLTANLLSSIQAIVYREQKINPWQKFAKTIRVNFVPDDTKTGPVITGNYRKHYLTVKTLKRIIWVKYTYISLENYEPILNEQIQANLKDLDDFLDFQHPRTFVKGEIKAEKYGQKVYYEQLGVEHDAKYLRWVFNLLTTLIRVYPKVLALGGQAVSILQNVTVGDTVLKHIATRLLQDIAQETTTRLASKSSQLLCTYCLTRCTSHKLRLSWKKFIIYYGCRVCHQSRKFLDVGGEIVLVLDKTMATEFSREEGSLQVNWLIHRKLFDFDRVKIVQATDEDVERFAIQVGNDTDETRKLNYQQICCSISPGCQLSRNTVRILKHTFEHVEEWT